MDYPIIDKVALDLGFIQIHWYGLMYLLAFVTAYLLALYRTKLGNNWDKKQVEDLVFYTTLGAVLGGRLGYMLFYNLSTFLDDPISIVYIQNGGMSFHGGFLGVIVAMLLLAKKYQKTFFTIADFVAPLVPLGLGFGRIGNFINGELWGKLTSSSWGIYAPDYTGRWAFRHPSQLYEAFLEGLVLFLILWIFSNKSRPLASTSALFLIFYGLFRFIIEFVRMPDVQLGYIAFGWLTMGQLLTLPMILLGIFLLYKSYLTKINQ